MDAPRIPAGIISMRLGCLNLVIRHFVSSICHMPSHETQPHPCSRQPCTHATMQPTPPCTSRTSATSPRLRVFQTAWPSLSLHGIESECVTHNVCFEYQASHDHSTLRLFSHSSPPRYMAGHVVELEYDGAMLMGLSDVLM